MSILGQCSVVKMWDSPWSDEASKFEVPLQSAEGHWLFWVSTSYPAVAIWGEILILSELLVLSKKSAFFFEAVDPPHWWVTAFIPGVSLTTKLEDWRAGFNQSAWFKRELIHMVSSGCKLRSDNRLSSSKATWLHHPFQMFLLWSALIPASVSVSICHHLKGTGCWAPGI